MHMQYTMQYTVQKTTCNAEDTIVYSKLYMLIYIDYPIYTQMILEIQNDPRCIVVYQYACVQ